MKRKLYAIAIGIMSLMSVEQTMALELLSSAFQQDGQIPSQYTCDGKNVSPPLFWKDSPEGTKSFVLIVDDPDAPSGTWDHWIIYNIPPQITSLSENLSALPDGALNGKNSWNTLNYAGPCPPDKEHRYLFKLYALDTTLPANSGMSKQEIETAISGHVLASTTLVGRYQRSK
jgi:Raf kinase inhibitor-like YbhB/YbcL family protein